MASGNDGSDQELPQYFGGESVGDLPKEEGLGAQIWAVLVQQLRNMLASMQPHTDTDTLTPFTSFQFRAHEQRLYRPCVPTVRRHPGT